MKWDLPNVFSDLRLAFLKNFTLQFLLSRFNFSHLNNFDIFTHCSTVFTFQYFFQVNRFYVSLNVLFIGTYIVVLFTLSNWFLHAAFFLLQPLIWWRCILIFIFSWVMMHLARLPSQTVNNCRGIVNFLPGIY